MTPQVNMRASWLTSSEQSRGSPTNHGPRTGRNRELIRYSRIESHMNTKQRKCKGSWIDSMETSRPALSATSIVPDKHMNHPKPMPPKVEKIEAFGVGYFGERRCGRRPCNNNRPSQNLKGWLASSYFRFCCASIGRANWGLSGIAKC